MYKSYLSGYVLDEYLNPKYLEINEQSELQGVKPGLTGNSKLI